ncbi:TPM domain-containing protein OS=Tsukamurella paurometabola (strain ATCC 8368 / DSM / CCUG 35730/ CIP 100753 / JCM 10117 / KCTC 9821 / NBRC 16120 / NCIMB 702349 / NCTC 13040) OX=521096 GN=Tpau_2076 PE=4 SV=1 [Tsukamurella paurometabola]|uniref:TPM domain-containing protein n=1 Tax=Tsukamurella paurometabola (strain ATCC 8368 / DSM 20162 / CCUG 35730 / CIP 100753 / JCM 10117 / KCTC 9821 / NBRC 16120 / NCIMB 702349 / NCTC 13040) TaxID=521096 RepID=D5UNX0_TSUPD|nr:DUF6676 family protein [Tsukamurella paurometabola]ADG78688.1 conserved hypothetical protein [Tsukamurella paurometabola DSM 20162]SUP32745.1 Uncharacterised protein [Tsukamurella paurometabola]
MGPLPILTEVPTDVDMTALKADLADGGVAILNPAYQGMESQVAAVVKDAEAKGIENFKVIVLAHDYRPDTSLRDLGTELAKQEGGTMSVLVMSPTQVAGFSTGQLSRYQIEKAQDGHKPTGLTLNNPPAAARDFVDIADNATFPWAGFTVALVLFVAVLAGVARVITRNRSREVDAARRAAGLRPDQTDAVDDVSHSSTAP